MVGYVIDLSIVAILVIGITALIGVLTNGIGVTFFGGKKRTEFTDKSAGIQSGWKLVGGKKK
ncbi:hypothetical protein JOC77_003397 [Peribacillus deserti]|uniref:Uncharacterized protein n=1 Tax=Peribacillus deserti TaxID=673318 RepID=A0ABS2QN95_9BACI|nr:hypothetical protein [Peribacillus deserti]MBM7693953.1 hypothetical protein [Peribacillus deserti]